MVPFDCPLWIVLTFLFVLGAVIGSFLNVCIYRIPQHEGTWDALRSLAGRPSSCPYCETRIRWHDNVPILGWLMIGGRCRSCRHRISIRYPAIELLNGLLLAGLYWYEVPAGFQVTFEDNPLFAAIGPRIDLQDWRSATALLNWRYLYHVVLVEALLVATFIDFDLQIIPDAVTLPAMAVGVAGAVANGSLYLVPVWFQDPGLLDSMRFILPEQMHWLTAGAAVPHWISVYPHWHGLAVSLAGVLVGGGIVWMVRILGHWVLRQEAMGFGDVILMAMIGSFIGWQPIVVVFFLAPLFALAVVIVMAPFRNVREIPYGPYLSLATIGLLFGWQRIWPHAERIFSLGPLIPLMAVIMATLLVLCLLLVQGTKRLLGIPLYHDEVVEAWTSADQLSYQSGERTDPGQGRWNTPSTWIGEMSGQGRIHLNRWRRGNR